jgi:hypothetical protein
MENTGKSKTTNYFKEVSHFSKNIFTSELSNTGATYNIFDFVINNLMVLILLIIIIGLIVWGISYFKNQAKKIEKKTIEDSFYHSQLDNSETYSVKCNTMEIPKQINKYTYAFNLTINDFYCNKGTWKCLMLKGGDMSDYKPIKCAEFGNDNSDLKINKNISPEDCYKYVCNKEYKNLKPSSNNPDDLAIRVDADDLNKRVDLICRATKMDKDGKDLLACGISKCNLMGKDMLLGHANSFIDAHNEYCTKVYTGSNKIDKNNKERYADEIDNVCSNKILIEKYPHLVPRDLTGFLNSKQLDRSNIDKFDDNLVDKNIDTCWNEVIKTLPIQSPGVWLHPFINNMRIVFTTYTSKKYDEDDFNFSHSHDSTSFTEREYDISKINRDINGTEHPNVIKYNENGCDTISDKKINNSEYVYREFFDIKNIPIKEMFHFALVVNEHSAEVYINAKLVKTQILFGEPRYNEGDLYLNYGGDLNGSIMDFKYVPHSINQNNILNLLRNKPVIQDTDGGGIKIDKEHPHDLNFNHTHKYDHTIETDHQHTLEDKDVPKDYYTED